MMGQLMCMECDRKCTNDMKLLMHVKQLWTHHMRLAEHLFCLLPDALYTICLSLIQGRMLEPKNDAWAGTGSGP